jgi:hypothetical protein
MSFNIEHWYHVLGPSRTFATSFLAIDKSTALALTALHALVKAQSLTEGELSSQIMSNPVLSRTSADLQKLIDPEGSFVKPPHEVVKILL